MQINHDDLRMRGIGVASASPGLPVGVHLRWGFHPDNRAPWSAADGFLSPGFKIYRRLHENAGTSPLIVIDLTLEGTVPAAGGAAEFDFTGASGAVYTLKTANIATPLPAALNVVLDNYTGRFTAKLPSRSWQTTLTFSVSSGGGFVNFDGVDDGVIADAESWSGSTGGWNLTVREDRMDGVGVESQSATLTQIQYYAIESTINLAGWTQIAGPLAPSNDWAVVSPRLLTSEVPKLGGPGAPGWDSLAAVVTDLWAGASGEMPWDPATDPLPPDAALTVPPSRLLLLSALDPTLARAVGLLYIDTAVALGVEYDYMVEGIYGDDTFYWISRKVSTNTNPAVQDPTNLSAAADLGPRWEDTATGATWPGGRVELSWDPPVMSDNSLAAYAPVRYEVETQPLGIGATADPIDPMAWAPIDPDIAAVQTPTWSGATPSWGGRSRTHTRLNDGWRGYQIRGIDLFGRGGLVVGPVTARVPADANPPPPPGITARYLSADVPDLTSDESAWVGVNGTGVSVQWAWPREPSVQNPQVTEFRVYLRAADRDVRAGAITGVTDNGDGTAAVTTDVDLVTDPGDFSGGALTSGGVRHGIVSHTSTAASEFTVTMATYNDPSSGTVTRAPTSGADVYVSEELATPTRWDERVYAQPHDLVPLSTTASSVTSLVDGVLQVDVAGVLFSGHGHAGPGVLYDETGKGRYAVLSHEVDGGSNLTSLTIRVHTDDTGAILKQPSTGASIVYYPGYAVRFSGVALSTSASQVVESALIGVSSADADGAVADDPKWSTGSFGGRPGNEGAAGGPRSIVAVWTTAPSAPATTAAPTTLADPPDYQGRSTFTLGWPYTSGLRYHLLRATAEGLVDEYIRTTAPSSSPDDYTDADVLSWAAPGGAMDDLFTPVTEEALDGSYASGGSMSYTDALPGRGNNRFLYRLIAEDTAGNRSDATLFGDVVYVPLVAPRAPRVLRCLAGDGEVTITWARAREARHLQDDGGGGTTAAAHRPELVEYRIYRTTDPTAAEDARLMTMVDTAAPTLDAPTESYTDTGLDAGTTYYYRVSAAVERSAAGAESRESPASGRSSAKPYSMSLPEDPAWTGSAYNPGVGVELSWSASDASLTCKVERSAASLEGYWSDLTGWLDEGDYAYTDDDVASGETYSYRLRVKNRVGFDRLGATEASETIP